LVTIRYDAETHTITVGSPDDGIIVYNINPEEFLDAVDECLLLKIKKINLQQITNLDWYINSMKKLADDSLKAKSGFDLRQIKEAKNCLAQIRYAIKLGDMMEAKVRSEMLERRVGKLKQK